MNIKKLLLELDPRKDNAAAVSRARLIATRCDAHIDVLVYEQPPLVPTAGLAEPAFMPMAQEEYRADVDEWVKVQVAALDEADVDFSVTRTDAHPRYEAILDRADASGAELIIRILGEHGRLKRLLLGATDWDLIRHARQPLWLVPSDGADISGANVMAAVDPTHPEDEHMKLDKRILDYAKDLGNAIDGSLHVYHTYQLSPMVIPAPTEAMLSHPRPRANIGLLEQVESAHKAKFDEFIKGYGLGDDQVHLLEGDPAGEIEDVIDANGIGVVVAGAISRSWLDRLLIGSTAESLLDAVGCDLILLKAES